MGSGEIRDETHNVDIIDKKLDRAEDIDTGNDARKKNLNSTGARSNGCDTSSSSSSSDSESSTVSPPDGGWGWMVVFASFIVHVIADGCGFSIGVLNAEWLEFFGDSTGKTAFISSLFVAMPAIFGPVASIVTNRFGCRRTTIAGGLIAAAGCFVGSFANSIEVLCVTFSLIAGFGLSLVYVPAVVVVAFYFEKKRAFAIGIAVAGSGIGTFIFAPLIDFLIDAYTWRGAMIIISGIMLQIVVFGSFFRPLASFRRQNERYRYKRSLEKFSRVSSRRQSGDGLDRRPACNHDDEFETCVFCETNSKEPLTHSLVLLPTYLSADSLVMLDYDDLKLQRRQNGKSMTDVPSMRASATCDRSFQNGGWTNRPENVKESGEADETPTTIKKKRQSSDNTIKQKKIPFPGRLVVPRYRTGMFFRAGLPNAGFRRKNGGGQSASCPDVFVHDEEEQSSVKRFFRTLRLDNLLNRIRDISDLSIFKNSMFICFCIHSMMLYVSYDIPYVYIPSIAKTFDIPDNLGSWLVSIIGIVSTFGQVVMGFLGDCSRINCLYFYIAMIAMAGLATLVVPALTTFSLLATYCGVFGFFISANFALTTIIVVELLGMEQLTNAYGFISLAEGLANLVGPPLAGWIIDRTESYDLAFYLAGLVICLSGLMLLIVPFLRKCASMTSNKEDDKDDVDKDEQDDTANEQRDLVPVV